ncbi:DinB family protein [SAR202 cluster bacterium AD-804-J14_MRT_500m]|nr:DinB family protein [SAR202 cluster bacterium AD-804-J14_MRT_500m]
MDIKQFTEDTFAEIDHDLDVAMDGLTTEELNWRPTDQANPIGFTLWHMARAEDFWINGFALQQTQVFVQEGWPEKWGIPAGDTGGGYTKEQVNSFATPDVNEIRQYERAVRKVTIDYLRGLGPADFDFKPESKNPRHQGYNIGRMFGHILCELSQHLGHIRYLRGLQRGINQ